MLSHGDLVKLFEIYRDYAKHEDSLSNFRVTWFLAVQGLLFGGYAVLNQARLIGGPPVSMGVSNAIGNLQSPAVLLTLLLALFGLFAAHRSYVSVKAAISAVQSLNAKWTTKVLGGNEHPLLPDLTGGGNPCAASKGPGFQTFLPIAAMIIWLLIALLHVVMLKI
jgi:hypothetical protein